MSDFLKKRIRQRELLIRNLTIQIRELQRKKSELQAEVRAYEDIAENLEKLQPKEHSSSADKSDEATPGNDFPRISAPWREILKGFAEIYPDDVNIDGIRDIAKRAGHEMTDETLRSQLSVYTSRNWLERVSVGRYRFNVDSAPALGISIPTGVRGDLISPSEEEEDDSEDTSVFL